MLTGRLTPSWGVCASGRAASCVVLLLLWTCILNGHSVSAGAFREEFVGTWRGEWPADEQGETPQQTQLTVREITGEDVSAEFWFTLDPGRAKPRELLGTVNGRELLFLLEGNQKIKFTLDGRDRLRAKLTAVRETIPVTLTRVQTEVADLPRNETAFHGAVPPESTPPQSPSSDPPFASGALLPLVGADKSVPEQMGRELVRFVGTWTGEWSDGEAGTLIVEQVDTDGAQIVYRPAASRSPLRHGRETRTRAWFRGEVLVFRQKGNQEFSFIRTGPDVLDAVKGPGAVSTGTFLRLTNQDTAQSASIGPR